MMLILILMLQLQLLLQLSSSNRPPRRLWSCNNDSGGGDALLGEHGKSRTHTHTHNRVWNDAFARGVYHACRMCQCSIGVVVGCCGCCRLILRLQCVRSPYLVPVRYHDSFRFPFRSDSPGLHTNQPRIKQHSRRLPYFGKKRKS